MCDVKGDVSGIATAGVASESMDRRIDKFGIRNSFSYKAYPVCFWDIYQEGGHPVRATISDMDRSFYLVFWGSPLRRKVY